MKRPKYVHRAWLKVRNGQGGYFDRFGHDTFPTSRAAMVDAVKLINEVKADSAVEWRNDIETYGSARELAEVSA
jgi:hypothetical protein